MSGCVIVGAGPGGLAVAGELSRRGLSAVVLEAEEAVAARWRTRYDRLRINTSSVTSFLPGRRLPLRYGRWPTRDQMIAYYRSPAPYAGRRVVVVGAGSSAVDVALDLLEGGAASVTVSVRRPPHLFRKAMGPIPSDLAMVASSRLPHAIVDAVVPRVRRMTIGDLAPYGLPAPEDRFTERVLVEGMIPVVDPGGFVPAVRRGDIRVIAPIEALDGDAVLLADGTRHETDAIVAATG